MVAALTRATIDVESFGQNNFGIARLLKQKRRNVIRVSQIIGSYTWATVFVRRVALSICSKTFFRGEVWRSSIEEL